MSSPYLTASVLLLSLLVYRGDFVFTSNRIIRLLVEEGQSELISRLSPLCPLRELELTLCASGPDPLLQVSTTCP